LNSDNPYSLIAVGWRVRVRLFGESEWAYGTVAIASENRKSIGIALAGPVRSASGGLWVTFLPLILDHEKQTITGLDGGEYELEHRYGA
jgi:hypothetical protein